MKNKFMSYDEYVEKQKEISKKIDELSRKIDYEYDCKGRIDTASEKQIQKLIEQGEKLENEARKKLKKVM